MVYPPCPPPKFPRGSTVIIKELALTGRVKATPIPSDALYTIRYFAQGGFQQIVDFAEDELEAVNPPPAVATTPLP